MSRTEHSRNVDGKSIRFGVNPVTKTLDVPDPVDTHEFIQALAFEFADAAPEDYPLDACVFDSNGDRQLNLATGWTISPPDRAKLNRVGTGSTH